MLLTAFRIWLGRLPARNRSEDSHLAGGAALLASPNTLRYSHDLDFFHDSEERVATVFAADRTTLVEAGCSVEEEINQPGYVHAIMRRAGSMTKIEWSYDSSWRSMLVVRGADFGYRLHPVDVATNKVLTLAGRGEPRDLLDEE